MKRRMKTSFARAAKRPGLSTSIKLVGLLSTYFETGLEGVALMFYHPTQDDPVNPAFDPTKPVSETNFLHFRTLKNTYFLKAGDHVTVFDKNARRVEHELTLVKDRSSSMLATSVKAKKLSREEFLKLFLEERRAVLQRGVS